MANKWEPAAGYLIIKRDEVGEVWKKIDPEAPDIIKTEETTGFEQRWHPWGTVLAIGPAEWVGDREVAFPYPKLTRVYIRSTGTSEIRLSDPDDPDKFMDLSVCPFSNVVLYQLPDDTIKTGGEQ